MGCSVLRITRFSDKDLFLGGRAKPKRQESRLYLGPINAYLLNYGYYYVFVNFCIFAVIFAIYGALKKHLICPETYFAYKILSVRFTRMETTREDQFLFQKKRLKKEM